MRHHRNILYRVFPMISRQRGRRGDPNYTQITALVPKDLGLEFKAECTRNEISISEAIEQILKERGGRLEQVERAHAFIRAILNLQSMDAVALAQLANDLNVATSTLFDVIKQCGGKVKNGK